MTPDLLNAAGFAVFLFCLVAVVSFTARQHRKEPAMQPQTLPLDPQQAYRRAQRRHGRLARAAASFYRAPVSVPMEMDDDLDMDFVAAETRRMDRIARLDRIAHQARISWADLTDDEIQILRGHPACARRAGVAWSKAYSKARRAALRGGVR